MQFRIRKKLDMAKDMLVNGTMSIVEISDYLGFENVTYFTRLFKEYEKISPAKYRNYSK
ncbi:MAG: helix-turn-helix domain-containing protein [Clostridiales bacterium]|nr:MAG: helix-turn-helix domain-containing protein [Clostridiales bacterium]